MKCSDMKALLSAYANDELSQEQRTIAEQHLAECADCRATLEAYRQIRQKLAVLQAGPRTSDVKEAVMSKVRASATGRSLSGRWLRLGLAGVPLAVAAIAALFAWQPWNSNNPQGAVARAQAALENIQSYRFTLFGARTEGGQTSQSTLLVEFAAPDRYHSKTERPDFALETILIGDEEYFRLPEGVLEGDIGRSLWSQPGASFSSMISKEYTLDTLGSLKDVRQLGQEPVDGVTCLHYNGAFDVEKYLARLASSWKQGNPELGLPPRSDKDIQENVDEMRSQIGSATIELWIGKDDSLLRRMKRDSERTDNSGGVLSSTYDYVFSGFNEITIEPPVDAGGRLLPGWQTTTPDVPMVSANITAVVDNYNPSDRKLIFSINIANISEETLTDVYVDIPSFTDGATEKSVWSRWENGQKTTERSALLPGSSMEFGVTLGYDATSVSPDTIKDIVGKSNVRVAYSLSDGQQKAQTFYFEVPESIYTLSTDVPANLRATQLAAAGEYRIDETGASEAGPGVEGEINGKDYLFVNVNTQNSEIAAPPGILVLDIENPATPKKMAYLQAPEGTQYMMFSALHNNILYVPADKFIWVLDVSDPAAPKELAKLMDFKVNQMVFSGHYAFVNEGNHDITTLDISDPAHPRKIGSLPLSSASGMSLFLHGDYLFVDAMNTLYTIDASDPTALKKVSERNFDSSIDAAGTTSTGITWPCHTMGISVAGDNMYIALTWNENSPDKGFAIVVMDISDPPHMREIGFLKMRDEMPWGSMFDSGSRLYIFTRRDSPPGDFKTRMDVIDVSDPAHPALSGYGVLPDPWTFFDDWGSSSGGGHTPVRGYMYWFIGNEGNQPVIEIFDLPWR